MPEQHQGGQPRPGRAIDRTISAMCQDHDTHQGTLNRGMVSARCDIQFVPLTIAFGRKALPGQPPDPDQICPDCLRKINAQ